jgi:uncharacterized protein YndB with AHSA1/START domain
MSELEAIVRTVPLGIPAERAFARFTAHIGQWWPPAFSASGHSLAQVVITPEKIYEVDLAGNDYQWGTVTLWEPPHRIVLLWTLGVRESTGSQLELTFADEAITLVHRGLSDEDRRRFDDPGGWDVILGAYAASV